MDARLDFGCCCSLRRHRPVARLDDRALAGVTRGGHSGAGVVNLLAINTWFRRDVAARPPARSLRWASSPVTLLVRGDCC
ncbi:hypothetical protein KCP70_02320 [Salmonella enterica subsp. enterica]|nr:hypothetical protein KCP70_02320 [Salmonella enterica subsp. enterica]